MLTKLRFEEYRLHIQNKSISEGLQQAGLQMDHAIAEGKWTMIKGTTYKAASDTLGYASSRHKDWFDDQDAEAQTLLDDMHSTHLAWINDNIDAAKKSAYTLEPSRRHSLVSAR